MVVSGKNQDYESGGCGVFVGATFQGTPPSSCGMDFILARGVID